MNCSVSIVNHSSAFTSSKAREIRLHFLNACLPSVIHPHLKSLLSPRFILLPQQLVMPSRRLVMPYLLLVIASLLLVMASWPEVMSCLLLVMAPWPEVMSCLALVLTSRPIVLTSCLVVSTSCLGVITSCPVVLTSRPIVIISRVIHMAARRVVITCMLVLKQSHASILTSLSVLAGALNGIVQFWKAILESYFIRSFIKLVVIFSAPAKLGISIFGVRLSNYILFNITPFNFKVLIFQFREL